MAPTYSNGNLQFQNTNAATTATGSGTCATPSSGKWYYEYTPLNGTTDVYPQVGVSATTQVDSLFSTGSTHYGYRANGQKVNNSTGAAYGLSYTTDDIIGVALNLDAGEITFYKNGVSQGVAYSGITATAFTPALITYNSHSVLFNFGQRAFAHTPPAGFEPLVTQHFPDPTIQKPSTYFDAKTYTGTGAALSITGLNFQPDFIWIKDRTAALSHALYDTLRKAFPYLSADVPARETGSLTALTSFNSDGFTLGTNALFNTNTNNYISWNWDEGATPGFDIVTYTGTGAARTISHSLGSAPEFMVVKRREDGNGWSVYHPTVGATKYLELHDSSAPTTLSTVWNDTAPTSSVFSVGTHDTVNASGAEYVAYLWSEVEGFSKFGSYTGNGSATDGPFVYTGFKPRWILIKESSGAGNSWVIRDTARTTYNPTATDLYPDQNAGDSGGSNLDILSNGFKIRNLSAYMNTSNGTYIYAAFAESHFKGPDHSAGYQIARSLRFNAADSPQLTRTPSSASNRDTFTLSFWVKRGSNIGSNSTRQWIAFVQDSGVNYFSMFFEEGTDKLEIRNIEGTATLRTTQAFRDPSAWYHIVLGVDTTQATAADRWKLYVNGSQVTAFDTATYPTQNTDQYWNSTFAHRISGTASTQYLDGYLADFYSIDGQALTPSSFGETDSTTGMWKPKSYSGTYGTNGFNLNFSDNSGVTSSTLGNDTSGVNNNDWTPNNFSITAGSGNDSLTDTPTRYGSGTSGGDVRGNFATLNPLWNIHFAGASSGQTPITYSNGNLTGAYDTGAGSLGDSYTALTQSLDVVNGKYHFEWTVDSIGSGAGSGLSILVGEAKEYSNAAMNISNSAMWLGHSTDKTNGNQIYTLGTQRLAADSNLPAANDRFSYDIDLVSGAVVIKKNGSTLVNVTGLAATTTPMTIFVRTSGGAASRAMTWSMNFGQRVYVDTPATAHGAIVTQRLSDPTIQKPSTYFDAKTYTGTGAALSVTGLGFQPELVWLKDRTSANAHGLFDSSRSVYGSLASNATLPEAHWATALQTITSTGFTLGASTTLNTNTNSYISWNWDESATSGFDIVTYTGNGANRTVSHSLGAVPKWMIVKDRSAANDWAAYTATSTTEATRYLLLNSTAAMTADSTYWNNTAPTASVFSVGTNADVNTSNNNYVAYLWSEVEGFSKFGSYTGNGAADGPFIYTGFKPRWVLIKDTTGANNWNLVDTARSTYNPVDSILQANSSSGESGFASQPIDIVSNGFKIRTTVANSNTSGNTYIYAAFAEMPFKYASSGLVEESGASFLFGMDY